MNLPINKDGNIELDLFDIVSEVIGRASDEEREAMVQNFAFQKPIREWMVKRLAEEFSRPSYSDSVHKDRLALLKAIKVEELNYYADLIADKANDERRHHNAYWELYWYCQKKGYTSNQDFPRGSGLRDYTWDWKKDVEAMVKKVITEVRSDLLEPKYTEPVATEKGE